MNEELRYPGEKSDQGAAGEDERRRSRSESSPAVRPAEGPPHPADDAVPQVSRSPEELASEDPASDDLLAADEAAEVDPLAWDEAGAVLPPNLSARRRGQSLARPNTPQPSLSAEQRLLLLDTWQRSGLPAGDFAALVGLSKHTLYGWKKKFDLLGPGGLVEQPRGTSKGSRLPELTRRTILLLKQAHPEWGCQRISDLLFRGPALPASPAAVARALHEAGYELQEAATHPHPDHVRHFERARPNQLWQTDLFTFVLKRQNRRVYLVAFMDDHSRFITGYGLHASQSAMLVLEVLRASLTAHGAPEEILTDNGAQYVTWRGKSQFTRELEKRGIRQIVARPRRPQTLGKIERFWGTLWRECVEAAVFLDLADARQRIGLFIDHYNFQRPHQGIEGLVPADRFFGAAPEVLRTLKERVAAKALELARQGVPKPPFYLTGQLDGQPFSVHREGDRVVLRRVGQEREEIELVAPSTQRAEPLEAPRVDLPRPVCPDGSPPIDGPLPDADLAPGLSPLDELDKAMPAAEGASAAADHGAAGKAGDGPGQPNQEGGQP